jgi:hypothetical protein
MAALTTNEAYPVFIHGASDRVVVYAIRKVSTSDTLDVSAYFQVVKYAHFGILYRNSSNNPTISGTTLTFAAASQTSEVGWLTVVGSATAQ